MLLVELAFWWCSLFLCSLCCFRSFFFFFFFPSFHSLERPLKISCTAGLVVTKSFNFCVSGKLFISLLFWTTALLDKEFLAAYFSGSAHWIYPASPFWPAKFLWIGLLWTWSDFPCMSRTFIPLYCFHGCFLARVFCEFGYVRLCWWSVFVESNGSSLCFLNFDVCVFPQVKEVFHYDLLT